LEAEGEFDELTGLVAVVEPNRAALLRVDRCDARRRVQLRVEELQNLGVSGRAVPDWGLHVEVGTEAADTEANGVASVVDTKEADDHRAIGLGDAGVLVEVTVEELEDEIVARGQTSGRRARYRRGDSFETVIEPLR
jgi:hypothetical protein